MIETVPSGTILRGHYRVERVLGSGGFGHVYLAVDLTTNHQYALKEYLVTGASGQEQLKHEATVLGQLHHPNLPAFQDAFIEHGRYYVVINYIEGNDLTDLIRIARQRNESVPIPRIMAWLLAICDAVIFLHSQQPPVIHRDIKPDNIRVTSNGTAILVDLGNAKAAADGARTLFFIRHQGTPGYAPPEQYPGGSGTDIRSDVYALGGTLYFALTAHEPPSVSTRNQALQQGKPDLPTLHEHLANNPPKENPEASAAAQFRLGITKPSKPAPRHSFHVAQLGTLPLDVLNTLNRIIQRAMALKPKDRYQSVADLAHDLQRVAAALSLPPHPPHSTPPNTADTHRTQPDVSMLYETMQSNTEEMSNPDSPADTPSSQRTPSSDPSALGSTHCTRCHTLLPPHTLYCPRCGSSAGHLVMSSVPMSGRGEISPEQTIIAPRGQASPASSYMAQSSAHQHSIASMAPARQSRPTGTGAAADRSAAPMSPLTTFPPGTTTTEPELQGRTTSYTPSHQTLLQTLTPGQRVFLLLVVVLVVLLVLILLFSLLHDRPAEAITAVPATLISPFSHLQR